MQEFQARRPLPQVRRPIQIEPQVIIPKPITNNRSRAYICSVTQLVISVIGFAIGLAAYTTTDNIRAGSFWPHIAMGLAAILFLVGLSAYPKGKAWLIGGLVLNALGLIMAFIGGIVDGVEAGHVATTDFNKCAYALQAGTTFCQQTQLISSCKLTIKADTCFCCYVHKKQKCEKTVSLSTQSSEYQGVKSCGEIEGRFQSLLWASMILCIINFIIGIASMILISYYKSSLQTVGPTDQSRNLNNNGQTLDDQSQLPNFYPDTPISIIKPPDYEEVIAESQSRRNSSINEPEGVNPRQSCSSCHGSNPANLMPPVHNDPPPAYSP